MSELSSQIIHYKGNLVFMNNLYHKVAVASVCTALSFILGANEEAKAATVTLPPTRIFEVRDGGKFQGFTDYEQDGVGDDVIEYFGFVLNTFGDERANLAEFNINSYSDSGLGTGTASVSLLCYSLPFP